MIAFYDEVESYDVNGSLIGSAGNPLPVGVFVTFFGGTTVSPATATGVSSYITLGGLCNVTLEPNSVYTAVFEGAQAPNVNAQFTTDSMGNANTVNLLPGAPGAPCSVVGYRSPSLSSIGYAIEETNLWPNGWFSTAAKSPGGTAFAVAAGLGNLLAALDYEVQACLALMRLQTIAGASFGLSTSFDTSGSYDSGIGIFDASYVSEAIDAWAFDFFGDLWVRQPGMSDAQWVTLIETILQTPKLTLSGIQQILTAWAPWFTGGVSSGASPAMGLDTFGGTDVAIPAPSGATTTFLDVAGGASGLAGRSIIVFDASQGAFPNPVSGLPPILKSSATLNSYLSSALVPGQIAVYFQNAANPDSGLVPVTITNPLLLSIVQHWKAGGVNYISGGAVHPCLFLEN